MQISITLDIATLNPSQFKAFTELAQSFREVYYIPESVVEPIAPTGSDITPPKRRRKSTPITDTNNVTTSGPETVASFNSNAYADLVHDVTVFISRGFLTTDKLNDILHGHGVANMPELAQKLHLVPAIRTSVGL